jgi:hypothetical protein
MSIERRTNRRTRWLTANDLLATELEQARLTAWNANGSSRR